MRSFIITVLSLFLFSQFSNCQSDTSEVSFLFIGDIMGHDSQINSAFRAESNTYDYSEPFKHLDSLFHTYDFPIANLEVTLAGPIYKGYPQFSSPDNLADCLKKAGIKALVTANNHSVDRRKQGLERTIDVLDSLKIPHTGTFKNQQDRNKNNPMIIKKDGMTVAILNYTYGTNGLPVSSPNIVNHLDTNLISKDITHTKSLNPDIIIAFVHWGIEYKTTPNKQQISLKNFFNDKGVPIVIGSHPHVVQKMELETKDSTQQFTAYSLGNFASNQRTLPRDGGAMTHLVLQKANNKVSIKEVGYILTWVYTPVVNERKRFYILPASKFESHKGFMDDGAHWKMRQYIKTARKVFESNIDVPEIMIN